MVHARQVATLTLVLQGREVRTFELTHPKTTIGRAQDNDIVINNLALSRHHAEVMRRAQAFEVQDRGSQNGVFVNEERIRGSRVLRDGDTITMGTYHFVFRAQAEAPGPGPASSPRVSQARAPTEISVVTPRPPLQQGASAEDGNARRIPLLVLRYNDVEVQRFPLEGQEVVIGRSRESDIQIAERRLSRRHCKICRNEGDRVFVRDLGSQNGTFVNRQRIDQVKELQHGDVLNFAEYSILFLADVEAYDGPDRPESRKPFPAPRVRTGIEVEETELPPAFMSQPDLAPQVEVLAVRGDQAPPPPEPVPVVEPPRRAKAKQQRLDLPPDAWVRKRDGHPSALPQKPQPETADLPEPPGSDVDDPLEEPRPDAALDAWYGERERRVDEEAEEEPSALLERSPSRVSRVLSTMMIDKRELDRNLARKAKRRRYKAHVTARHEVIFSGPLENEVTILGKDPEADILLQGRYVAGRHSLLVHVRDSLLLVRLGSSSAARVNGLAKLQAFLRDGDVIQIDETTIEISEM